MKLISLLITLMILAAPSFAATYTVTNTTDIDDGGNCDANCSLREAINRANQTGAADTIVFAPSVTGTVVVGAPTFVITNTLTINGPGARDLTLQSITPGVTRAFQINPGVSLAVSGIKIASFVANNDNGGCFLNNGTLSLSFMDLETCVAGQRGGGIYNSGTLTLANSLIARSTAGVNAPCGGGIFVAGGNATVLNSTISGGSCFVTAEPGAGIAVSAGSLTLNNVTVAFNQPNFSNIVGGLYVSGGTANLRNTLLAGNGPPDVGLAAGGTITSNGNNLVVNDSSGAFTHPSDILGRFSQINGLANNGGPTDTHSLRSTSPAIDAGNNCVTYGLCNANPPSQTLLTDQRGPGFLRLAGTNVDIGAYEFLAPTAAHVPISGQVTNGNFGLNGATVQLVERDGTEHLTRTSSFGYFVFEDIEVGQGVVINVLAKGYSFDPYFLFLVDEVAGLVIAPVSTGARSYQR